MRVNFFTTGRVLALCALLCAAGASWSDASVSRVPTFEQSRPLFPDVSRVYPGPVNDVIRQERQSTRGWFGDQMVRFGILDLVQKVTLEIDRDRACDADSSQEVDVEWIFPEGYYLPKSVYADTDTINIIAWRSFPVKATVTCEGESAETYTTWVEVK